MSCVDPVLHPIGVVESVLTDTSTAPRQGTAEAPDAWLVLDSQVADGLRDLKIGDGVLVLTWLDRARRDLLTAHPRGCTDSAVRGVFSTRSPHRPNPIGLHPVTIREIDHHRVRVGPIEAVDGTPVIDLKPIIDARSG